MALAFILGLLLLMTSVAAYNPRAALYATIFLVPWSGLDVDIGLRVTAYQVALAALILVTMLRTSQPGWQPPALAGGAALLAMVLHATIWSLVQIGFIPILSIQDTAGRGPTPRAIIQVLLFVFNLAPVVLVGWLLRDIADLRRAFRIYIASLVVLAVIGWIQVILWFGIGYNPLPLGAVNAALGGSADVLQREGLFSVADLLIYRMNSFCNEPRNLATALALGLLFLQAIALAAPRPPAVKLACLWLFFFVSMAATFSTSGIGVWVAASAALLPAMWLTRTPVARSRRALTVGAAAFVLPLALGLVAAESAGLPILDVLAERTIERVTTDGAVEDFDLAISGYLAAVPSSILTGVGLGNAHLYAMPYLDPLFALYKEDRVFTGKVGGLRIVSELGLIGLGLMLFWYLSLLARVRGAVMAQPALIVVAPMAAMAMTGFLVTNQLAAEAWIMGGAMTALCRMLAAAPTPAAPVPA